MEHATYTINLNTHERGQLDELAQRLGAPSARQALLTLVDRELNRLRASGASPEYAIDEVAAVVRELQAVVAQVWGVDEAALMSESRARSIAWARQNWYVLLRERLPHIGIETLAHQVGRDHSTLLYGITQARQRANVLASEAKRLARARLWLGL